MIYFYFAATLSAVILGTGAIVAGAAMNWRWISLAVIAISVMTLAVGIANGP